jgi:uncharacterized membrane protein
MKTTLLQRTALMLLISITLPLTIFSQTEISSTITDQFTREALSGARVFVKSTKTGTVANSTEKFTLKTPSNLVAVRDLIFFV